MTPIKNPAPALISTMTRHLARHLCLSASFIALSLSSPAYAAEVTLLPQMTPSAIAADSARSYDSATGISIVTAPTFDPFEQDETLAGKASLRTGASATTIDGKRVHGGAFLDLTMIYTTPSEDPYDMRGFEQSVYISGKPVSRIKHDMRTLDCSSNTTEVVYQDGYYDSYNSYGYLAGLYLLLPRYRGHRGYWDRGSRHHANFGWRDWRRGYYGHGGYGRYDDFGSSGYGHGYSGHGYNGGGTTTPPSTNPPSTNSGTGNHTGSGAIIGGSATEREYVPHAGIAIGEAIQTGRAEGGQTGRRTGRTTTGRTGTGRTATPRGGPIVRGHTNRITTGRATGRRTAGGRPSRDRGTGHADRSGSHNDSNRPNSNRRVRTPNPAGRAPTTIARQGSPHPIARSEPPRPVSQPAPRRTQRTEKRETRPVSRPREATPNSGSSNSGRSSRAVDRAVDRSFRNDSAARGAKRMNFFPSLSRGRSRTDVYTNYRCVREETVTLHIPQHRIDAARFDGMTVVIIDDNDQDIPIYLPPNYIEGFRQATGRSSGQSSHQSSGHSSVVQPSSAVTTGPTVGLAGSYPQN